MEMNKENLEKFLLIRQKAIRNAWHFSKNFIWYFEIKNGLDFGFHSESFGKGCKAFFWEPTPSKINNGQAL